MRRRRNKALVSRNDGILLRRIAQAGGIIETHYGDSIVYAMRNSGEQIRPEAVRRLIDCRVLLAEDRGLFSSHPQSWRVRTPADGRP